MKNPETVARLRAGIVILLALLLVVSQAAESTYTNEAGALPIVIWALLSLVLLVHMHPVGLWQWKKAVRENIEDEGTAYNRAAAYRAGFWTALIVGALAYSVPAAREFPAREVVRVLVSATIAAAAIRFSWAEMKAMYG